MINIIEADLKTNEGDSADVASKGGHFDLSLTNMEISTLEGVFTGISNALGAVFGLGTDGSQSGVFGIPFFSNGPRHNLSNGYSLHSNFNPASGFTFHLDTGNPYGWSGVGGGIFRHVGNDVVRGNLGACLDP
jgi:hypothetical protein